MGLLGLAGSLLGMIPKVGSPGGKKKGKSGGSKGKSSKKSSKKKGSTKKKQRKSNKKKKKRKNAGRKRRSGVNSLPRPKLKNSLSKSKLVKWAKKAIKKAVLTTKKVVQKTKAAVTKAKQQVKTAVQQTKQVVKEKVLPTPATKKPTNNSSAKAKASSVDKNRITSEAELKALLDEHRKTRVIGSDGEPITTLIDKRKVLSAESTATPDGLAPYVVLGSKMSYALFIEDYLKLSDANAPIKENFEAGLSLINPVRKVKKGEEALESIKNMEKVIEETYGLANNSKKAKDAQTTQKEIDQLGEYVKKLDKGTDKVEISYPLSSTNKKHINKHNIESLKQQSKYLSDSQLADKLESSFFNPKWSKDDINKYAEIAYNDLKSQGKTGNLTYEIGGEIIDVFIHPDGQFGSVYGRHKFTVEDIRKMTK
ncbi:hypothetical protein [Lysinibacillus sp. FSL W7-1291]|uniref:hypothetical protein n=1 Tax=Lysinibacillus sp. FSL W7-1291 TaxID=2954544 RepID=UPI0031599FEF